MVQILRPQAKTQNPTVAQRLSQGVGQGLSMASKLMEEHKKKEDIKEENEAAKRMGVDLSGVNDPKSRQQLITLGVEKKQKEDLQKSEHDFKAGEAKTQREHEIELAGKKLASGKQDKVQNYEGALSSIQTMKKLRKKGNLGRGSSVLGFFGGDTAKDRGEYETLGNSLISFATTIPIRNRVEFEKLAGRISDPSITDDEAEGILTGMEKIINDSAVSQNQQEAPNLINQPGQQKRPLSAFQR